MLDTKWSSQCIVRNGKKLRIVLPKQIGAEPEAVLASRYFVFDIAAHVVGTAIVFGDDGITLAADVLPAIEVVVRRDGQQVS